MRLRLFFVTAACLLIAASDAFAKAAKQGSGSKAKSGGCPPAEWVKKAGLPASVPASLKSSADYLGVSYSPKDVGSPKFSSLASACGAVASKRVAYEPKGGGVYQAYLFKVKKPFKVWRLWSTNKHPKATFDPPEKFGGWWSASQPRGLISKYREANAICQAWNVFEHLVECEVRAGVILAAGPGNSVGTTQVCPSGEAYKKQPRIWQLYLDTWGKPAGDLLQRVFQKCTVHNVGGSFDNLQPFDAGATRFTRRQPENGGSGSGSKAGGAKKGKP